MFNIHSQYFWINCARLEFCSQFHHHSIRIAVTLFIQKRRTPLMSYVTLNVGLWKQRNKPPHSLEVVFFQSYFSLRQGMCCIFLRYFCWKPFDVQCSLQMKFIRALERAKSWVNNAARNQLKKKQVFITCMGVYV